MAAELLKHSQQAIRNKDHIGAVRAGELSRLEIFGQTLGAVLGFAVGFYGCGVQLHRRPSVPVPS